MRNEADKGICAVADGEAVDAGDDGCLPQMGAVVLAAEDPARTVRATRVIEMPAEEFTAHGGMGFEYGAGRVNAANARRMQGLREQIGDAPLEGIKRRWAYRLFKRAFDVVFSLLVLVCFCWLYAVIAILVKADDPKGPVIFSQDRVGRDGRTFKMHKFRSMCVDAEDRLDELQSMNEKTGPVFKIKDDPRVTRVGHWLRKLSLDELPQFWDVLKGDIPLRIFKMRQVFSGKMPGAFALPANEVRTFYVALLQVNALNRVFLQALQSYCVNRNVARSHPSNSFAKHNSDAFFRLRSVAA